MVRVFFLIVLLLAAFTVSADSSGRYFQNGCILFRYDGSFVKNFPGQLCVFLEDGRVISASETEVRLVNPDQSVPWKFEASPHHQMNLTPDGKRIVFLSSELRTEGGTLIRYDEFIVLTLEGNLVARNTFRNLGEKFGDFHVDKSFSPATRERSHFNSIFEIGPQKPGGPAYLAEGNFIANSVELGTFIFSRDLKTVLHHFKVPGSNNHRIHDVKVTPEGNYLMFVNEDFESDGEMKRSAIREIEPETLKTIFSYRGAEGVPFYSGICGGVEKINADTYVFSLVIGGTYLLSAKTGEVFYSVVEPNLIARRVHLVQNMRLIELSQNFRKAWKL